MINEFNGLRVENTENEIGMRGEILKSWEMGILNTSYKEILKSKFCEGEAGNICWLNCL
jgi:hypothetical protein